MRKAALTVLITLLTGNAIFGQEIGFRGGLNFAKTGGDSENVSFKPDFHVGLFWSDNLTRKFTYYFDATYSRQGGQVDPRVLDNFKINNNYLNISSLMGFKLYSRLTIFLGPQLGIRLNGRIRQPGVLDENATHDLSLLNLSLTTELQYQVQKRITIYTRYAHGLTSNVSQDNPNTGRFPDRVGQIGIAVSLGSIDTPGAD